MKNLTENENKFLNTIKINYHADLYNCTDEGAYFDFDSVCDYFGGLDPKVYRGVLSSLIKKNIVLEEEIESGTQYYWYEYGCEKS